MRCSTRVLATVLFALVPFAAHAAIITNTYEVTASGFSTLKGCSVAAPVDPVTLAFSISFDNSAPITNSTANITLISLNMPHDGPLIYTYASDYLIVGDAPNAGLIVTGHNYFELIINNISTSPTFGELYYTVSSPASAAPCRFGTGTGTVAVGPPWTHLSFPMHGLRRGQTIRLNIVAGPVPYPGPGPLCQAQLNIYDATNNLIASQLVSPPGSVSFDYDPGAPIAALTAIGQPLGREELRPEVILMPTSAADGTCQGQATAEVYDDVTKSTSVITPGLPRPSPSQLPAVQLGPVGVGFLQTLRLNVVAAPPDPCFGTLSFTDTEGNPIGASSPVRLTAGQATFIDLQGAAVAGDSGHEEVMAVFTQTPGVAPGVCIPSVEVYSQLTGTTQVLIPPVLVSPGPPQ